MYSASWLPGGRLDWPVGLASLMPALSDWYVSTLPKDGQCTSFTHSLSLFALTVRKLTAEVCLNLLVVKHFIMFIFMCELQIGLLLKLYFSIDPALFIFKKFYFILYLSINTLNIP